jgi:putative ATP-dependent endonuclease of the OLD family
MFGNIRKLRQVHLIAIMGSLSVMQRSSTMKIESVYISNFKSYSGIGTTVTLSSITGFIGPNSAGKTNVLEALDVFFHPVKLDESMFHKKQTASPICIEVTFSEYTSSGSLAEKILAREGKITLRRIYQWNSEKQQADADKNLYPCSMWYFCGEDSCLNPFPNPKPSLEDIKVFLSSTKSEIFRLETGITEKTTLAAYNQALITFWGEKDYESSTWQSNFKWLSKTDIETIAHKALTETVNAIVLPDYIYLPIEHSIADEMTLKKGSRIDILFSSLLKLTEKEQARQKKAIEILQLQADKYYSHFYDKKLTSVNKNLNSNTTQWNFSNSKLKIERSKQAFDTMLQPAWNLIADDGFRSEIGTKGNGIQRLATFQLLQTYADFRRKGDQPCNVVLAIEEPELYLHPPYKRALYHLFRKLVDTFQIVYTTHDPIYVQLEYFDEMNRLQ